MWTKLLRRVKKNKQFFASHLYILIFVLVTLTNFIGWKKLVFWIKHEYKNVGNSMLQLLTELNENGRFDLKTNLFFDLSDILENSIKIIRSFFLLLLSCLVKKFMEFPNFLGSFCRQRWLHMMIIMILQYFYVIL